MATHSRSTLAQCLTLALHRRLGFVAVRAICLTWCDRSARLRSTRTRDRVKHLMAQAASDRSGPFLLKVDFYVSQFK